MLWLWCVLPSFSTCFQKTKSKQLVAVTSRTRMISLLFGNLGRISQVLRQVQPVSLQLQSNRFIFIQASLERARRGTRERKAKLLKKRKAQKAAQEITKKVKSLGSRKRKQKPGEKTVSSYISDEGREPATDDVWFTDQFKFRVYSFAEAIKTYRETYHPSMYNMPDASIHAYVELNMTTDKLTKFVDPFTHVVTVRYPYKHSEERSILAFCKLRDQLDEVTNAGATLAGSEDIIKAVKKGKIMLPDFQFVIAHPNIMPELASIRGLLKKKFPRVDMGTLGTDLTDMVNKLLTGIKYQTSRDEIDPAYGVVDFKIGTLDMEIDQLEDNFKTVINDVKTRGPRRKKRLEGYRFITRCFLTSPPVNEKLLIPIEEYVEEVVADSDDEDDEDDDEVAAKR